MAKKQRKRKTKVDTPLTLGDVELDIRKAYAFFAEEKYAHPRQALSRARRRLNAIRGLPLGQTDESN